MQDIRLGATIRTLRLRRHWRQSDLADAAGISRATIWRIERGHLGSLSLDTIRTVCAALEIRLDLMSRWRGGELDRVLGGRHSRLHESVARWFAATHPAWDTVPEVSFNV